MVIWNLSKLKPATFWKDIVKMIKLCNRVEENFANLTLDKGFLSRIYEGLLIFSNEKTNNPIKDGQNISTESLKGSPYQLRCEVIQPPIYVYENVTLYNAFGKHLWAHPH